MAFDMSQHMKMGALVRYTLPSIGMMVFMSLYVMVDGVFVSWCAGSEALAAVNFTFPVVMLLGTVGYMMGVGGGALVAKTRGEGEEDRANRQFSMFVYVSIGLGVILTIVGLLLLRPVLVALGAGGELLELSIAYGTILIIGMVFDILQYVFQSLVMTAGKPRLGFWTTVAAGLTNIALDALLIGVLGLGVEGAAWATIAGMAVGSVIPLVYFARPNTSPLRLGRTSIDWRALGKGAGNGLSEMVSNISMSVVSIVYNVQLLRLMGSNGVDAYGVTMYVLFLFSGVFMGYAMGSSPLMSYQYGAQSHAEMQSLLKKSLAILGLLGIAMFAITRVALAPIADAFVGYDAELCALTEHALGIYSFMFLIMGFGMYGPALFTALNNGVVSALISFLRTFVFEIGFVLLLPALFGADAIWYSGILAEITAVAISALFVFWLRDRYGYLPDRESK